MDAKDSTDDPRTLFDPDPRGEFPFAPEEYLFLLLIAINRHRDAQLEQLLKGLDLSLAWHRAMLVVGHFGPCTMTELADFSVVDRTTMTRTVDHLVESGWVDRAPRASAHDRRQVVLTLTEAGRAKSAEAARRIWEKNRKDLEGISETDSRTLVRLSQDLAANLAPDAATRERILTFRRPAREV